MRIMRIRRHWRWVFTLLLIALVVIVWVVIINRPTEPMGRLLIERQDSDDNLIYVFDFITQKLAKIQFNNVTDIRIIYQLSLSKDGNRIAFIGSKGNQYGIYVADVPFNDVRLVSSGTRDTQPQISPDGSTVVFMRSINYFSALFSVGVDTEVERQLTEYTNDLEADWSPDGKRIVFTTSRDGFQELYSMAADGSDQQRLTNNELQNDLRAQYSPDGKWIAYMTNYSVGDGTGEIWLMDADGQNQRQLTHDQLDDREPIWSPDSRQIVFTKAQPDRKGTDIFVYDVGSEHIRQLTDTDGYEFQPVWSPNSDWIAFESNPSGDGQQLTIDVMRADGTDRHPLLGGTDLIPVGRGFTWTS